VLRPIHELTDDERIDALDHIVGSAAQGEDHAIVCLFLALSPRMEEWACDALGDPCCEHGSKVVKEFTLALAARQLSMPSGRGTALSWLEDQVRDFARRLPLASLANPEPQPEPRKETPNQNA
jgi:hypothetical protein